MKKVKRGQKSKIFINRSSMLGQTRGQMKLSFGMIFSIILIITFIAFAFYAIQKFLDIQNAAQVAKFANDLQFDIDKIWKGSQGSQKKEYFLPSKIKYVCFIDYDPLSSKKGPNENFYDELKQLFYETENLFFYPLGSDQGLGAKEIKHIDLEKTTENENPFCTKNIKGKVSIIIKKDFNEALVTLSK